MFGRRPDATLVRELSAVRRFMPFISPRRNESVVYFEHTVDAESALAYLEQLNVGRPPERRITFFHLVLHGLMTIFHERPRLNRFVAGGGSGSATASGSRSAPRARSTTIRRSSR